MFLYVESKTIESNGPCVAEQSRGTKIATLESK